MLEKLVRKYRLGGRNMADLLEMKNITKTFPGVIALDEVEFNLKSGETHILLGENGAGKSTLMKVLSGAYDNEEGTIYFQGEEAEINTPEDAFEYGINVIYQELQLTNHMSIYENIFLGREFSTNFKFIDRQKLIDKTEEVMDFVGLEADPSTLVKNLTVAQKQLVEIAKALAFDANVIVFDEPTATLTDTETERLFNIIHQLKEDGLGLIYISHRLEEFKEVGDRCTVLRDGKYIDTVELEDTNKDKLINMMVGEELEQTHQKQISSSTEEQVLEVKNISYEDQVKDVSLDLRKQEILGIAGLVGAGRTELAKTIIGEYPKEEGEIYIRGEEAVIDSPAEAIKNGIIYLSEDRQKEGLFLGHSVRKNITISSLEKIKQNKLLQNKKEKNLSQNLVNQLNIRTPSTETKTLSLSGGNQQKVVIAKGLCKEADIYIFDEPTRGIDVGAKEEIYEIMEDMVKEGASLIMISSEIPELMRMSDRILVMYEGESAGIYNNNEELTKKDILAAAVGEGN